MTTFNVYRRESNDTNPPVAIATGLTTMSYSDTTAVESRVYLYSVGAVKNGVEKISNEVVLYPKEYISALNFDNSNTSVIDLVDSVFWTATVGGVVNQGYSPPNSFFKQGGSALSKVLSKTISGDFYVSFRLKASFPTFFTGYIDLFYGSSLDIRFGDSGFGNKLQFFLDGGNLNTVYSCSWRKNEFIDNGGWIQVEFQRKNGFCSAKVNGSAVNLGTGINPSNYPLSGFTDNRVLNFASINLGSNWYGYIDDFLFLDKSVF